ncbi:unnamed protein product [Linum trigynum]|uniref:Uncharacterized protein n=1 Tax=Linum trigynum TaxID=586398 RepID=A0AAV2GYE8_9ROSI
MDNSLPSGSAAALRFVAWGLPNPKNPTQASDPPPLLFSFFTRPAAPDLSPALLFSSSSPSAGGDGDDERASPAITDSRLGLPSPTPDATQSPAFPVPIPLLRGSATFRLPRRRQAAPPSPRRPAVLASCRLPSLEH